MHRSNEERDSIRTFYSLLDLDATADIDRPGTHGLHGGGDVAGVQPPERINGRDTGSAFTSVSKA